MKADTYTIKKLASAVEEMAETLSGEFIGAKGTLVVDRDGVRMKVRFTPDPDGDYTQVTITEIV